MPVRSRAKTKDVKLKRTDKMERFPGSHNELTSRPIAVNQAMIDILNEIKHIAPYDESVFLCGESGTGKSLFARIIHALSSRRKAPFVEVNCGSLSETLLESELFGHLKGSFTDALTSRVGKIEEAQGGTLLLDDITSSSIHMQTKLLHVFENKEIQPVGSNRRISLDVRFICASNKNLPERVKNGSFREDLYYRTYVVNFNIPPLRKRKEDIIPLIEYFLKKYGRKYNKTYKGITEASRSLALSYDWPGNVRELKNTVARSIILAKNENINLLFLNPLDFQASQFDLVNIKDCSLRSLTASYERMLILQTLDKNKWNYDVVCKELQIGRSTLYYKIKKHNLERRSSREK
jgi:transcriptional regulator with PAS, ATPase and Fis domain